MGIRKGACKQLELMSWSDDGTIALLRKRCMTYNSCREMVLADPLFHGLIDIIEQ